MACQGNLIYHGTSKDSVEQITARVMERGCSADEITSGT
jgi:hypothetical protein